MTRTIRLIGGILLIGAASSGSANACAHAWRICGPATSTGSVSVQFTIGSCTATGTAYVTNGTTAQDICNALKNSLNGQCSGTQYACAPDPDEAGCYRLVEATNASSCDTGSASGCCGVSFRNVEPEWG